MMENAHAIEDAGAAWVTVHARTKADGYTPPAFWDQLQPIREALKSMSLPMVKSGPIPMRSNVS